jgi:hypothetical protein
VTTVGTQPPAAGREDKLDKELEQYRSLMEVPSTFEDGFSWTALAGAIFVALLMVPGAMYMSLLAGQGVGPAAQWVTVILFIEVARRAHKTLKKPEIFVLYYMAGAVMATPFSGLLWNQFFVQSQAATGMGVADKLPAWFAPSDPAILDQRSFIDIAWLPAILLASFGMIMGRLNSMVLTYGLFRIASDIEKLPFPMAPIGAQGISALAEQQIEESSRGKAAAAAAADNWRWRVFSIGGILGMVFGALYMALPAISGALLNQPITILPIPFADWTPKTAGAGLSAVATGLSFDMGQLVTGMVLPFFAMLGSFIGLVVMMIANPLLYKFGILTTWNPSDSTQATLFANQMDFYFSFSIGIALAIAVVGLYQVIRHMRKNARKRKAQQALRLDAEGERVGPPPGRGDIKTPVIIGVYSVTSLSYILLSGWLIDWHPGVMVVLIFFAFLYTPLISYVTARLEGLAGQVVEIPMVREAAFILSGYTGGVKVWFIPVPVADYGRQTVFYRQAELTGTRFWSIWKAELILVPIVLASSIFFSQFIWSLAPIPSSQYPFTETMWELQAANQSIMYSATLGGFSKFEQSFNPLYLGVGAGFGLLLFAVMSLLQLPIMLIYGLIRGLNQTLPHVVVPQFIGALLGRYYFERRLGLKWRQYVPVVAAGFACGMGLVTVLGVGMNFLSRSVISIPF